MTRLHLWSLQGREVEAAGGAARREERTVVDPLKRHATPQHTFSFASRSGLYAQARNTLLRALPMVTDIARGPRLVFEPVRANAALGGTKDGV